jgi:hypothetical protein
MPPLVRGSGLACLGFYTEISGFFEAAGIFFIFIFKSQSREFLGILLTNKQFSTSILYTLLSCIFDVRFRFYNMTYEAILPEIGTRKPPKLSDVKK